MILDEHDQKLFIPVQFVNTFGCFSSGTRKKLSKWHNPVSWFHHAGLLIATHASSFTHLLIQTADTVF